MAGTLNDTPGSNRLHIGIFGKTNSGKSSFINAFTGQQVSIVADVAGTTTDPVFKAMELPLLGPCIIMDTAGFDDGTALGRQRLEKTKLTAEKTELAVILVSGAKLFDRGTGQGSGDSGQMPDLREELAWYRFFRERETPVLFVINKVDVQENVHPLLAQLKKETGEEALPVSAKTGAGMDAVREALARKVPENYGSLRITADLVGAEDVALLVMPQDIQAPKGRLILPQVQTIRELLDRQCIVMCVTAEKLTKALGALAQPPKLIITDSQVFGYVYEHKPRESMLTSFSVLFAAYKGDLPYYVEGARQIDALTASSRVLIAECCTHAPLTEDIGRVKLPGMLKKRFGRTLAVDIVSGTDFPQDLSGYDLIIQCGACMFNRKYVLARIDRARQQQIPMTNYGVAIAHLTGILDKITLPQNR